MSERIIRDPYSGEELGRLPEATSEDIARALSSSQDAFKKWRTSPAWRRSELLHSAATRLTEKKEEFANLISREAGKPIRFARIEVDRAIQVLLWASSETQRYAGELLRLDASNSGRSGFGIHTRFPRGPVLGITPFNFPLNLVIHKIAPALASGCPILIKPSPVTPLVALRCAELFADEPSIVQVLNASDQQTAKLTLAEEIKTISFTGSAAVGRLIRRQAPDQPCLLELGGNAWVFIFEDTAREHFPAIARKICHAAFGYAGQSCISVQNVAVAKSIRKEFELILCEMTQEIQYGDPALESVISGPVIHLQAAQKIRHQIENLPSEFQKKVTSNQFAKEGRHPYLPDTVIAPTLILSESVDPKILPGIISEEIFGPVMTLTSFQNLDHAIQLVNSGRYGLQSGAFTQSWPVIDRLYRDLEVGGLVINDVPTTRYDHQPYGGVRDSGFGREGVRYAMDEMTESKFLALSSELPQT